MKTQTEADRKVGWAVQKAHTQFPDPISEDGCWVSSVESSCCKSVSDSPIQAQKVCVCIPSGPWAYTVPWSPNTWARTEPRRLQI